MDSHIKRWLDEWNSLREKGDSRTWGDFRKLKEQEVEIKRQTYVMPDNISEEEEKIRLDRERLKQQNKLFSGEPEVKVGMYPVIWGEELETYEAQNVDWLIKGWLVDKTINIITGKADTFKTFLALYMGLCVSKGIPWLNSETQQGKVIYFDRENNPDRTTKRLKQVCKGLGTKLDFNKKLGFCFSQEVILSNETRLKRVERMIEEYKPRLLIFDTYRRFIDFKEDSADDTNEFFMEVLKPLTDKYGVAISLVHHNRKGREEDLDMLRGSSDIANNCDGVIHVKRKGYNLELKQLKQRDADKVRVRVGLRFEDDDETLKFMPNVDYDDEPKTNPERWAEQLIVWIKQNNIRSFETQEALNVGKLHNLKNRPDFYEARDLLVERGVIESSGKGRFNVLDVGMM